MHLVRLDRPSCEPYPANPSCKPQNPRALVIIATIIVIARIGIVFLIVIKEASKKFTLHGLPRFGVIGFFACNLGQQEIVRWFV